MRTPATLSRTAMAPNTDTRANLITWFATQFGFSIDAATALHDVQALNNAQALSKLDAMTPLQMSARRSAKTSAHPLPS